MCEHTVDSTLNPAPVLDPLMPPPVIRRLGRYFDTTTIISSVCLFTTHTHGGMPFIFCKAAPIVPLVIVSVIIDPFSS